MKTSDDKPKLSKREFIEWRMTSHGMNKEESLNQLVQDMFNAIAEHEGANVVTVTQFRRKIKNFDKHLKDEEIDHIIQALDTEGTGEIKKDELKSVIKEHMKTEKEGVEGE